MDASLPMAQVELLQVCVEHSPVRVSELASHQRLAQSTVSGLVATTATNGLVIREVDSEVDSEERRAAAVRATDAGRLRLAAWTRAHERRLEHALTALPHADRAALRTALPAPTRLAASLEDGGGGGGEVLPGRAASASEPAPYSRDGAPVERGELPKSPRITGASTCHRSVAVSLLKRHTTRGEESS
ncbi:MarR family winged helix-turn-helix transcriptional regulator [Streptomyces sp. NBC_01264]|uniref:MarR family winged helix-turn-helix transcriptional regulator n=1 Tax=Streptomyces sp. NBC_01264 TaxID=2903804 RepID=UPI00225093EE|nr:MarR family winged helix-turn-helix transcriptional regulator [Streptomyces sp. NBC_01264]MCX4782953.1 MarR family winged helix-turn-helix transcriptional regulator [Streptomyces sp. NBC_01264]